MARYLAIDIVSDGLLIVAGTVGRRGQWRIDKAISWTAAEGASPPPLSLETADTLGEQLRQRLREAGIAPAPALVAIGRGRVILKELRYPPPPATEEPNLVRYQVLRELTDAADEVVIDYTPFAQPTAAGERRSMAVVLRKDLLTAIHKMCAAAGLKLLAVTPRPYAVAAGLRHAWTTGRTPPPEHPNQAVASLLLAASGGEFTVTQQGEVTFTRELPAPVCAHEVSLLAEIRRNIALYAAAASDHPIQAIYVSEADHRWSGRLRGALSLPVHAYDPLAGAVPEMPEVIRGQLAGAVGLLAAWAGRDLPINLASPRQAQAGRDPYKVRLAAATVLAALLLAVGGLFGYLQVQDAQNELVQLQRRKTDLDNELKLLEPDMKRLQAVRQWQARGVNWLDELYDWSDRFPHGKGVSATQWTAAAIPPDPKTGKQPHQARVDLKLKAPDITAATRIYDDLQTSKYYSSVRQSTLVPNSDYAISAAVNARPPQEYTRGPDRFNPPDRRGYPPKATNPEKSEKKGKSR